MIKELPKKNPELAQAWQEAKHDAEAQSKFIRESGRFPLTAVGDINTYAVFAETTRKLISCDGRVGVIVPTGIATDDTCKKFFGDLIQKQALASLYDFENRENIFDGVGHGRFKFSLLSISGQKIEKANFSFFLTQPRQIDNQTRIFQLSPQDISLLNPNTLTCPILRTRADAEITKKIYGYVPVLENEVVNKNDWGISFLRMFDMANDSGIFKREFENNLIPLYEAKMFWHYNHRFGDYADYPDGALTSHLPDISEERLQNPNYFITPRYWVHQAEVENRLGHSWKNAWLIAFRNISNATNERTAVFTILPKVALAHSSTVLTIPQDKVFLISCLLANFSSIVFDFVTRQKMGGTNFSNFILKQLPVIPPKSYTEEDIEFIKTRVLELVYTACDMQPFAKDMGYGGKPFIWNPNRRALLRAELDAYYAKLYGLTRDEL
ncbi:hypothetical protein [Tolypothrix sp. PCC 7910]|uniref:hypothetical protein n=1 Tax=Tolypothrix sp. PCC 7910 TaxID=2099387 RepID=UPI001FCAB46E|nr:hypothetical protein [Tolypothrix sp. PCC 7910]